MLRKKLFISGFLIPLLLLSSIMLFMAPFARADTLPPTHNSLTASSATWNINGANTYNITFAVTDPDDIQRVTIILNNWQSSNSANPRGYFDWHVSNYSFASDQVTCGGAGGGRGSKHDTDYGPSYTTLVSCSSTTGSSLGGTIRTITLTVRPETTWGEFGAINDIALRARDTAGNWSAWQNYDLNFSTVNTDASPPNNPTAFAATISGQEASGSALNIANPTLNFTWSGAEDAESGIINYQIILRRESDGTFLYTPTTGNVSSYSLSTSGLQSGQSYTYLIRAKNGAGIWQTTFAPGGTFTVDMASPTISHTYAYHDVWTTPTPPKSIQLNAADTGGSNIRDIVYCWGVNCTPTTIAAVTNASTAVAADQTNTFRYQANDNAGNASEIGAVIVKIDSAVPTVTANPESGSAGSPSTIVVTLTPADTGGSGISIARYAIDGTAGAFTGTAFSTATPVTVSGDGSHTISYYILDNAGNEASGEFGPYVIVLDNCSFDPDAFENLRGALLRSWLQACGAAFANYLLQNDVPGDPTLTALVSGDIGDVFNSFSLPNQSLLPESNLQSGGLLMFQFLQKIEDDYLCSPELSGIDLATVIRDFHLDDAPFSFDPALSCS